MNKIQYMAELKYKVGDRVRIKSIDWYNENKDEYGQVDCGSRFFFAEMSDWCGKIATIKEICKTNCYRLEECYLDWTDEMIEGLVEEETKPKYEDEVKLTTLENLLSKQDNEIALQIFEAEIESLASKGYTTLLINHLKPELFKLCETTDINTILKYIEDNGYEITEFPRECYIDGCWNKENEDDYLTEIQVPVKKK